MIGHAFKVKIKKWGLTVTAVSLMSGITGVSGIDGLTPGQAAADDAFGEEIYHADKNYDGAGIFGGKKGSFLPEEKFVFEDRQQFAPVEETLFVVGTDGHCYEGSFHLPDNVKILEVDLSAPVAESKCIYQKIFATSPSGFSIFAQGGGVCRPTYADSTEELERHPNEARKIIEHPVALYHCTENTVSLGVALEERSRAEKMRKPAQNAIAVRTQSTSPGPPTFVAASDAPTTEAPTTAVSAANIVGHDNEDTAPAPKSVIASKRAQIRMPQQYGPRPSPSPTPTPTSTSTSTPIPIPVLLPAPTPPPVSRPTPEIKSIMPPTKQSASATEFTVAMDELAKHKYTIQFASETMTEGALRKAQVLKRHGFKTVFIFPAEISGETHLRVCTGLFDTGKAARAFLAHEYKDKIDAPGFVQILPRE